MNPSAHPWLPLLLGLAFPLLAHGSVMTDSAAMALSAVACLGVALLWPLRGRRVLFGSLLASLGALLWLLWQRGDARLPLMLPPVIFNAAVGLYFARSLAPGRMPLIERIVRAIHGDASMDPGIPAYTRRLTTAWAVLLLALAAICLLLALLATPDGLLLTFGISPPWTLPLSLWSLFANVINYVLIAAFFFGEYLYRRRRFSNLPYRNFRDFLARVVRLGPSFWRRGTS